MKTKIKKHGAAAVDFIKTVLIYVLAASMLATAGYYINEKQNAGQLTEEIPGDKWRIFGSGGIEPAEINENQINPVQIILTAGNKSFTAIYNNKLISDIYEDFKPSVRMLFDGKSTCRRLGSEEGFEIWKKCVEKENSVYIRYAGDYIYPVIYAFLDKSWDINKTSEAFSNELALVHEIFIVNEAPVFGVARDINGNIAVFEPESEKGNIIRSYISTANLSAYNNNAGIIPCEFLRNTDINAKTGVNKNNIKNLKFPEDFKLFYNYNIYSAEINFANPLLDEENKNKIDTDKSCIKNLFKNFKFNAESARSYSYERGIMFVDGKNTVWLYKDGRILYSYRPPEPGESGAFLSEGGIHLSKFLGYDTADYYSSYEKIKAANVFAGSIFRDITGNESNLYLKNITADAEGNLRVTFCYYFGGIKINIDGNDEGIIIVISKNSIIEVRINAVYINSQNMNTVRHLSPVLTLSELDNKILNDMREYYYDDIIDKDKEEAQEKDGDVVDIENDVGDDGENNINSEVDAVREIISKEEAAEKIAMKYKLQYDKIQDKFIVNRFELVYNINYKDGNDGTARAYWEIK